LAPAQEDSKVSGISGQLGGLASLAGINIGSGSSNKTMIAKEILQSRAFLIDFIHKHELKKPLLAVKRWNEETDNWVYDRDVYSPEDAEWLKDEDGESLEPSDWDLVIKFKEDHLSVNENKDTGMMTLNIKSMSPIAAKEWADWLVKDINERIRRQDVQEAESRIAYLREKLNETNIAGMQQIFYQLIESETRTVILANAQDEYILKTEDPAIVPEEKSEPSRALICILATLLGGTLGVFIVFVRALVHGGREQSSPPKLTEPT
jgi:LPS O-antigen subunit length determinant protein (WzzB/FepE family)